MAEINYVYLQESALMRGVTIGIPAFNARKTLERAIDSALAQTITTPYEIIIVDDGSTDTTANIAKSYELMFPNIIRLIRTENQGVASARNIIVTEAKYSYLTWLDSDDYYFPEKLALQFEALMINHSRYHTSSDDPDVMVFSPFLLDRKPYRFYPYLGNAIQHILTGEFRAYLWSSMVATEAYRQVGPFNESLHRSEDTDWLLRYLLKSPRLLVEAGEEPVMQYHFSTHRDGSKVEESLNFMLISYGSYMRQFGIYDEYVPRRYWEISNFYHSNKKWNDMWRCRALAAKYDPERYRSILDTEISKIRDFTHRQSIQTMISRFLE